MFVSVSPLIDAPHASIALSGARYIPAALASIQYAEYLSASAGPSASTLPRSAAVRTPETTSGPYFA